jgi:hypothetical protein
MDPASASNYSRTILKKQILPIALMTSPCVILSLQAKNLLRLLSPR